MAINTVTSIPYYSSEHADDVTVVTAFGEASGEMAVTLEDLLTWSRGNYDSLMDHVGDNISLIPRSNGTESQTAWDMRYAASKDHSVLWGLAPEELAPAIRDAHLVGVRAALEYMAANAVVARVQINNVRYAKHIAPLLVAVEHSTNRFDYPHLHTHALIFRDGLDPNDEKLRAIHSPWLYRHFAASRAIQRAVSRYELTTTLPGLQFALDSDGDTSEFRITAITRRFRNLFSSRQRVLQAAVEALGGSPAEMADLKAHNVSGYHSQIQRSVYDIRPNKGAIPSPADELRQYWLTMATEQDFDPKIYDQWLGAQPVVRDSATAPVRLPAMLESVFDQVQAALTLKQGTWTKETLIIALCNALPQGVPSVDAVMQIAEQFLKSHSVQLVPTDIAGNAITATARSVSPAQLRPVDEVDSYHLSRLRSRFATPETISYEHAFANWARNARGSATQLTPTYIEGVLANYPTLSDEQVQAVKTITQSPKGTILVRGGPGSGKTFMLRVAAAAWQQSGVTVYGVAKTGRAATELQMATPKSYTIDSFLFQMSHTTPPERFVVLCDEASMASTKELYDLAKFVFDKGGRLCLVGDHRQLPSIDAGGLFSHLWLHQERTGETIPDGMVEMCGNQRQVPEQLRYVVQAIEQNDLTSAIMSLAENNQWTTGSDETQLMHQMVLRWMQESSVGMSDMLAYKRDDVARLNMLARQMLLDPAILGSLGPVDSAGTAIQPTLPRLGRVVMRLPASKKTTEAGEREYRLGERIMCLKNQSFKYPQPPNEKGRIYRWAKVRNSWSGTIISATTADVTVRFDHGETITLPYSYVRDYTTYSYAKTIYRAQGITVGNRTTKGTALIYRPEVLDAQSAWVALTRATHDVHLYELLSPEHVEYLLDDHDKGDYKRIASDVDDPRLKHPTKPEANTDKGPEIVGSETAPALEEETRLTVDSDIVPDISPEVEYVKRATGTPWSRVAPKWKIHYKPETTLDIDFIMNMAKDAAIHQTHYELTAWVNALSSIEKLYDNPAIPSHGVDDTPRPSMDRFISTMVESILSASTQGGTYSDISETLESWLLSPDTRHQSGNNDFLKLQDLVLLFVENPAVGEAYRHFIKEGRAMSQDPSNPIPSPYLIDHVRHQIHQRLRDRMHQESTLPARIDELRLVANVASEYRAELMALEKADPSAHNALFGDGSEYASAFAESQTRAVQQSDLIADQEQMMTAVREPAPEVTNGRSISHQIEGHARRSTRRYQSQRKVSLQNSLDTTPTIDQGDDIQAPSQTPTLPKTNPSIPSIPTSGQDSPMSSDTPSTPSQHREPEPDQLTPLPPVEHTSPEPDDPTDWDDEWEPDDPGEWDDPWGNMSI